MRIRYLLPALLLCSSGLQAQDTTRLQYPQFLAQVGQHNLGYAAEKFNVDIASANIEIAKVFPDPAWSAGFADNGRRRMQTGYVFTSGLSWTLELGGKRRARIGLAKEEHSLAKLQLADYFRNLRADATLAYLQAIQQQWLYEMKTQAWQFMDQLAIADSIRFKAGAITETDARQSRVEAGTLLTDTYQSAADWKTAMLQLNQLTGIQSVDTLPLATGDLGRFVRHFPLQELLTQARQQRADLLAALQQQQVAQQTLRVARSSRVIDLGLNAGLNATSIVTNVVAPTPSMNTLSAGISVPLKFSNKYKGELLAANAGIKQSAVQTKQASVQVQTEVIQAYTNYEAATRQLELFDAGLLNDARKVLAGKTYAYRRGQTTLLEVLNAQRTYNDVQQQYYQTVYQHAAALVELERAAGIWDIEF